MVAGNHTLTAGPRAAKWDGDSVSPGASHSDSLGFFRSQVVVMNVEHTNVRQAPPACFEKDLSSRLTVSRIVRKRSPKPLVPLVAASENSAIQ